MLIWLFLYIILVCLAGFLILYFRLFQGKTGRHGTSDRLLFFVALFSCFVLIPGIIVYIRKTRSPQVRPRYQVNQLLSQIQHLNADTFLSVIPLDELSAINADTDSTSYTQTPYSIDIAMQACALFFDSFQYKITSEVIDDDNAIVSADITNIDSRSLACDIARKLTEESNSLIPSDQAFETSEDFFSLLKSALESHNYDMTTTSVDFHLSKEGSEWSVVQDRELQNELLGGFMGFLEDPELITPAEVLDISLSGFRHFTADEWHEYLLADDIFSTSSEILTDEIDTLYLNKISEFYDYEIEYCEREDHDASALVDISSLDMNAVFSKYREYLSEYALDPVNITLSDDARNEMFAKYLLSSLKENAVQGDYQVTVLLHNDGLVWHVEYSDELIDAILGGVSGALETFNQSS